MFIFLDIDGVMVPAAGWKAPALLEDGFAMFSAKAVDVLRKLITADTTIVLTTSHKSNYTIKEWKVIFERRGIKANKLKALDVNHNLSRKEEILRWFNTNKTDGGYIIIDDDKSLNGLPSFLKGHLILTNPLVGLTSEHLVQAQNIIDMPLQLV